MRPSLYPSVLALAVLQGVLSAAFASADDKLPKGSHPPALSFPHFPDRLHAVVWRNWQLVEPARIAATLKTDVANVQEVAASMGLPRDGKADPQMRHRGYITIIRRNWHLLPYEQLLTLLGMTAEELAFSLREDDFLYIKLGSLKPKCDPVVYQKPNDAAQKRAAKIKQVVEKHFGEALRQPVVPRFSFIEELSRSTGTAPKTSDKPGSKRSPRFIYSYFGVFGDPLSNPRLDSFPDGLLEKLAAQGVNGVWLHVVLRQLAPGGADFPEFGAGHEKRLVNLKRLVDRAKRHGIDIYLYMNEPRAMPVSFFNNRQELAGAREGDFVALCTSSPRVRKWISDSLAHVFREVPGLGGVFTITASENLTSCASHGLHPHCPRCKNRSDADIIAEVNATIAQGVHRSNPDARVIAWDWGWRGHGDAPDIIAKLPKSVWLMSVSEWALPIERGGVKTRVGEYSISAVGPGPRATRHWKLAKDAGLRTVAKVQLNITWELSTVPYLPVLDLTAEHCSNLAAAGVDGTMLSWSLGGYPSPNLQVARVFAEKPAATVDEVLDAVAVGRYGRAAAPHARKAWSAFSSAFREYPYHKSVLYTAPQQMGPANLLFSQPTGYAATMTGIPYDDLDRWRGPYPPDVFAGQFEKIAAGWLAGITHLEKVVQATADNHRKTADADLLVAKAARLHFASVVNQARFVLARDALRQKNLKLETAQRHREQMRKLIANEISLAQELFEVCRHDSRIGFEAANQYFYVPYDLIEKVINCEHVRQQYSSKR